MWARWCLCSTIRTTTVARCCTRWRWCGWRGTGRTRSWWWARYLLLILRRRRISTTSTAPASAATAAAFTGRSHSESDQLRTSALRAADYGYQELPPVDQIRHGAAGDICAEVD